MLQSLFISTNVYTVPYDGGNYSDKFLLKCMSKKGCFGEYNFGDSALKAHFITPSIHLVHQNLVNNHLFAK